MQKVLNYKLTRSFSSDVHLNGISSDQVVLLQSVVVLFFATFGEGLTTLSSGVATGFVRTYASVNFVFLASRHCPSLLHFCHLWTLAVKIEGVEGIRGVGSVISTSSSLDAHSGRPEVLAPISFSSYFCDYRLSRINWNVGKSRWFSFANAKLNYNSAFRIAFIIWSLFANAKPLIQFDFQNCIRCRFSFYLRKLNTIWVSNCICFHVLLPMQILCSGLDS